jgi:amidase
MALSSAFNLANLGFAGHHHHGGYDVANATQLANAQTLSDPFPYYFPKVNATPAELFAMPLCQGYKIEDASIDELQGLLSNGSLTSVEL